MRIFRSALLLMLLSLVTACSSVNKGFLQNFNKELQATDGSFASLPVKLKYSDKENILVVTHDSGKIDIWKTNRPNSKLTFKAHKYRVTSITFTADGGKFFSSSTYDNSTKFWNADSGNLMFLIRDLQGPVGTTPNEDVFVIANSREIRLFDGDQLELLPEKYPVEGVVTSIASDVDSGLIAIGNESGSIELWQYTDDKGPPAISKVASFRPYEMGNWVVGLKFTPDGKSLYSVARFGSIDEWSTHNLGRVRSIPTNLKYVYSVAFSRDGSALGLGGTVIKLGSGPGAVEVFSLPTGKSKGYYVNTNLASVEYLPSISSFIASLNRSSAIFALPPEDRR